ncbi:uncharacterized protein EKO05_0011404 [Ascochyta rabiei]|uniref:uncharacterized protein n=1 Tax=Didymella rabiei TaxID=5454 RepID=UPI002209CCC2|nr:uncharacterized protein EKO05_0011404 [Ascochyta rabiei]UPX21210.1 hypothetical protein EKO05_0011404 [Ascochyta rabiei]
MPHRAVEHHHWTPFSLPSASGQMLEHGPNHQPRPPPPNSFSSSRPATMTTHPHFATPRGEGARIENYLFRVISPRRPTPSAEPRP